MDIVNQIHQFENGLVLLYEEMAWSESFAIGLSVPSGSVWEPKELAGLANMTCEMTNRGAGQYDNRSFLEEFENIGVRSSEGLRSFIRILARQGCAIIGNVLWNYWHRRFANHNCQKMNLKRANKFKFKKL